MRDPFPDRPLTYAEFLAFTADKDERYEFVDGYPLAMGTPSDTHQRLAKRLMIAFDTHLAGGPCEVLPAPRLWTVAESRERAPDLVVFCEQREPKLVVEILSPNLGDDVTRKPIEYQALRTIAEYLVVDSRKRWVGVYRRGVEGLFVIDIEHIAGSVHLASIDYTLDIDALYAGGGVQTTTP